ncbi:hypothetical protein TWF481_010719 [Arthrobotrys musiformis]|uniref:F-box domain-containing protein n=1 Tax=Arthrobotrys musiformis TaxID=47236 RepID=A0AAV9W3R4_9PEZI
MHLHHHVDVRHLPPAKKYNAPNTQNLTPDYTHAMATDTDIPPEDSSVMNTPLLKRSLNLPTELEEKILCELSLDARVVASCVCRRWAAILAETPDFKKRRYTFTTPSTDSDVTLHRLVAASTGHMRCTLQDGRITEYTFFYWRPDHNLPLKVDLTNSPFLDDPVFLNPPSEETIDAIRIRELRFRMGGVICDPILRGFFWNGNGEVFEGAGFTVRRMAERIAGRLISEIESSRLLAGRGLTGDGAVLMFRPTGRWAEGAGNGMDAVRDNMSVAETSTRFGERSPYLGFVKQNPYQQNFRILHNAVWGV